MRKLILISAIALMGGASAFAAEAGGDAPVLTTKLSGFVMGRYNYNENTDANSFSVRLIRAQVAGRIMGDFDYKLQVQLNGTSGKIGGPRVVDAYVEWQKFKPFYVKFGQFKRAFTFENPMNPIDQGFYGYSSPIDKLAGMNDRNGEHASNGRDIGLQVQGDLFKVADHPLLHYQAGVYNGQGINVSDTDRSKDLIGGLWVIPVKGARIGVFGWDGTYTRGTATLDRKRYAISGEYKASDWTFRSEYVHSYGAAFKNTYTGSNSSDVEINTTIGNKADAWYALVIAPVIKDVFHVKVRYDVYRDNAQWDRCCTKYDFGADWQFTKNLVLSAIYSFVNDRRLADGEHDYSTADLQVSFRF